MSIAPGRWLKDNYLVYFGNATAVRDYRVQLRGNRAVVLWGIYLLVMIGFGVFVYGNTASSSRVSVVDAQRSLRQFYDTIITLLASIISLIAPALTATSVVSERQRRSLDLIFSAPVTPKYFLVGKMISSYRYVWMLLVLALPITSACVVLGGATWVDVVCTFILLSLTGLTYCGISILFSTLAPKPVSAIVWSYLACGLYTLAVNGLSYATIATGSMGPTREYPFTVTLSAFNVSKVSSSYSVLWGITVPNWILAGLYTLLVCKLFLLASASSLSAFGAKDTKMLRLHAMAYTYFTVFGVASLYPYPPPSTMAGGFSLISVAAILLGWFVMPLLLLMPFLSCYGYDGERKYLPDGIFNPRRILLGTPSSALPFVLSLVGLAAAGLMTALAAHGVLDFDAQFTAFLFWYFGLWIFAWSLGRLASGLNLDLRGARAAHFSILLALWFIPIPFLMILSPQTIGTHQTSLWDFYILRPIWGPPDVTQTSAEAFFLIVASGVIVLMAENMRKKREELKKTNEHRMVRSS